MSSLLEPVVSWQTDFPSLSNFAMSNVEKLQNVKIMKMVKRTNFYNHLWKLKHWIYTLFIYLDNNKCKYNNICKYRILKMISELLKNYFISSILIVFSSLLIFMDASKPSVNLSFLPFLTNCNWVPIILSTQCNNIFLKISLGKLKSFIIPNYFRGNDYCFVNPQKCPYVVGPERK